MLVIPQDKAFKFLLFSAAGMLFLFAPFAAVYLLDCFEPNNSVEELKFESKHYLIIASNQLLISTLFHLPILFFKKIRWYLLTLALVIYLPSMLDFFHVLWFKIPLNPSSFFTLFDTNWSESHSFITNYSLGIILVGMGFLLGICFLLFASLLKWYKHSKFKVLSYLLLFFSSLIFVLIIFKKDWRFFHLNSTYSLIENFYHYHNDQNLIQEYRNKKCNLELLGQTENGEETHVIVIGESTSKAHLSIYGYERNTNPKLKSIIQELTVFDHVVAPHVHTITSLKEILMYNDSMSGVTFDIVDLFKSAGYATYWLSNQHILGENQNWVSAVASKTDFQTFINPQGDNVHDEKLLPYLHGILQNKARKKVVFVHLIGTHLSYQDRYPSSYSHFTEENFSVFGKKAEQTINHYDNAVLYNDFVLFQLIGALKMKGGKSSLLYFSDHGDEVYDFRDFHGHNEGLSSKFMTDVPFIYWTSENKPYLKGKTELTQDYSLKNFLNTAQDLYQLRTSYYDSSKSILRLSENQAHESNATLKGSESNHQISFDQKIWVHRVNSVQRLKAIESKFKGIELDLVFEKGILDVRHPPEETIGLSLSEYLSAIKNISAHYFWLDIKNLSEGNQKEILKYLQLMDKQYAIKSQTIIESDNAEQLFEIKKSGFITSFYLPEAAHLKQSLAKDRFKKAQNLFTKFPSTFVSQSIQHQLLMTEFFPSTPQIIWALQSDWSDKDFQKIIKSYLRKHPEVKVCLVPYSTLGYR